MIDKAVVSEYLSHVGASELNKSRYKIIAFAENTAIRAKAKEMENRKIANN